MIQTSEKTRFTEAEMATVRDTDLPDLLISLGYQVKRIGRYYTTQEMDSIRIKDRRTWFRYRELSIYAILRLNFAVLWIDERVESHRFQCDSALTDFPVCLFPKITLPLPDGIGAWRSIELLHWLGALPRVVETGSFLHQPIHLDQRQ